MSTQRWCAGLQPTLQSNVEDPARAKLKEQFRGFSCKAADAVGSPWAFILAVLVIVGWAVTGPIFHFSDTWQLVINTGTTIVTFLMVFLIQNTQNRDARAMHLKLDELICNVPLSFRPMFSRYFPASFSD